MSIQDEINRLNQNVSNAYSALEDMGATLPTEQNSANIANAIRSIPQSGSGGGDSTFIVKYVPAISFNPETGGIEFHGYLSVDKSITEILTAANSGKNVLVEFDLGASLGVVQYARFSLTLYSDYNVNFDAVIDLTGSGKLSFLRLDGIIPTEGEDQWSLNVIPLVTSNVEGLTLDTSSTEPTVDNSNVITFVDEG